MKLIIALVVALSSLAIADPPTNYDPNHKLTDADILNYALTLEHLEDTFYRQGLANYTQKQFIDAGFPDPFYATLNEVSSDETKHVAFLTSALKAANVKPVPECKYGFPSTDPKSFAALAFVLEGMYLYSASNSLPPFPPLIAPLPSLGVGVSAYLGAAADILSKDYLTAAGSILTVESRHSAYLRAALGAKPFPAPFDIPLDPNEVHSIAHGLILSCPQGTPPLPVKAFPALTLGTPGKIAPGAHIIVKTPGYVLKPKDSKATLTGAFITAAGPIFVPVFAAYGGFAADVPAVIAGQSYFVICNCKDKVSDDTIVAGPVIVEVST